MTLNNVCGSSLKAINTAAAMIQTGQADIIVAGGTENMSASGFSLSKARFGYRMNDGVLTDMMMSDALVDFFGNYPMGITAENVSEDYGITREMQDAWSAQSQHGRKRLKGLIALKKKLFRSMKNAKKKLF